MDLAEWLFRKKMRLAEFALLVGYDATYICAVKNGKKKPGRPMKNAITKATGGEVTFTS